MAVLGLRALYFVLLSIIGKFWMLKYGIGLVLSFIGVKMLTVHWFHMSSNTSLFITLGLLTGSILLSLVIPQKKS
jgi:tellurite resistance protein TerC